MKRAMMLFAVSWIFLPGRYTNTPPVTPHVEALPDPRENVRVRSWRFYREPGYFRYEYRRW